MSLAFEGLCFFIPLLIVIVHFVINLCVYWYVGLWKKGIYYQFTHNLQTLNLQLFFNRFWCEYYLESYV